MVKCIYCKKEFTKEEVENGLPLIDHLHGSHKGELEEWLFSYTKSHILEFMEHED